MGDVYDALEGAPARVPGEDIGEYQIAQGTLAFPEEVADNYLVQFIPGTLKILDAGELPFTSVIPADFSFITGESGSKIRVQAAKGCIPEGATLALHLPDEKAVEELEALTGKTVLKGFLVSIMADGKEVSLPKYGSLKIQIPLTAEEAELLLSEPFAGFYNGKAAVLDAGRIENGSVAYLSVQIDSLGTVVIFKGEAKPVAEQTPDEAEGDSEEPKEQNSAFLWILGGFLLLLAVGGIVFTVIWTQKNGAPKMPVKPTAPSAPAKKPAAPPTPVPDPADAKASPPPQKKKNVISFDDLED